MSLLTKNWHVQSVATFKMALENFREILGVTATVTTIIQFLTGVYVVN